MYRVGVVKCESGTVLSTCTAGSVVSCSYSDTLVRSQTSQLLALTLGLKQTTDGARLFSAKIAFPPFSSTYSKLLEDNVKPILWNSSMHHGQAASSSVPRTLQDP